MLQNTRYYLLTQYEYAKLLLFHSQQHQKAEYYKAFILPKACRASQSWSKVQRPEKLALKCRRPSKQYSQEVGMPYLHGMSLDQSFW